MPRRSGGLFLPLSVQFMDDDRVIEAGEKAAWLYLAMALAVKRLGTDGVITARQVERLNVSGWRARLSRCVEVGLVVPYDDDSYGIRAWFQHNEAMVKRRQRMEKDREYQSQRRDRVGTESGDRVEKSREEVARVPTSVPDVDCEHGVDRYASCLSCVKQQSA